MKITDRAYGAQEITEPVILDLVSKPTMQRLKGID
jgi:HD superfamily phosphohydrolase